MGPERHPGRLRVDVAQAVATGRKLADVADRAAVYPLSHGEQLGHGQYRQLGGIRVLGSANAARIPGQGDCVRQS
jgi:hypothetical protein